MQVAAGWWAPRGFGRDRAERELLGELRIRPRGASRRELVSGDPRFDLGGWRDGGASISRWPAERDTMRGSWKAPLGKQATLGMAASRDQAPLIRKSEAQSRYKSMGEERRMRHGSGRQMR